MKSNKREEWLSRIAQGQQTQVDRTVPIYGEVPQLPDNTREVLLLPIKQKILDNVTLQGLQFETNLNGCKIRWGRATESNLEEKAEELRQRLEVGLPSEEEYHREQIILNQEKEMYNPDTKVLDMAKVRPTDLRDAPRLHLPQPRPQREECLMQAKRQMYISVTKEFIKNN